MAIIANKTKVMMPKQEASSVETLPDRLSVLAELPEVAVQRTVAKNPNTPPKALELLSHSSDKATRKGVALNPNSAKDILLALAPQFPGDFYQNPAFDWLLLEDPNLLFNIGHGVLKNILKRPECPESFIKWAAQHGSEQEKLAVAMNRNTSKDNLRKLVAQGGKVGSVAECHMKLQPTAKNVDLNQVFSNKFKELLHELLPSEASELFSRNLIDLPQFLYLSAASKICICEMNCDLLARSTVKLDAEEIFQVLYECALYDMSQEYPEALPLALPSLIARPEFKKGLEKFMAFVTAHDPLPETAMDKQLLRLAIPLLSIEPTVRPIPERLFEKLDQLVEYTWASDSAPAFLHPDCPQRLKDKYAQEIKEIQDQQAERTSQDTVIKADKKVTDLINLLNEKIRNPYKDIVKEWRKNPDKEPTLEEEERLDGFISECRTFQYDAEEFIRDDCFYFGGPKSLLDKLYKAVYSICEMMTEDDEIFSVDYPSDYFLSILETLVAAPSRSEWLVNHASGLKGAKFRQVVKAAKKGSNKDAISTIVENPTETFWFKTRLKRSYDKNVVVAVDKDDIFFIRDSRAVTSCNNKYLVARILGLSRHDAYPDALAKRSKSIEWIERMAVARNPNSPLNVIETLKKDPHYLVAMQALATSAQKQLDFFRRQALLTKPLQKIDLNPLLFEVSYRFMRTNGLPDKWISHLITFRFNYLEKFYADIQQSIKLELASNPVTSADWLVKLAKDTNEIIRSYVAKNPNTPEEVLCELAQDVGVGWNSPQLSVAGNPATPVSMLEAFIKASDVSLRTQVAVLKNPSTPEPLRSSLVLELSESKSWNEGSFLRKLLAGDPRTPVILLAKLSQDVDKAVVAAVAGNSSTPVNILEKMLDTDDVSPYIVELIIKNSLVSSEKFLAKLQNFANTKDMHLKSIVASCSRSPLSILETLSHDEYWSVRISVAKNPACPATLLEDMFLNLTGYFLNSQVRQAIAGNKNTPESILQKLSVNKDKYTRIAVACNTSATTEILDLLSRDKDIGIRLAVAKSSATAISILNRLAQDLNGEVRQAVRISIEDQDLIKYDHLKFDATTFEVNDFIVPFEIMFPDLSGKGRTKLAYSKDWVERTAAATSPETQPYLLLMLLEDEVDIVRQLSAMRLKEIESA